ncbi:MAG: hypothetical protein ABFD92_00125 [Planctomycetaceae bacterium]|nr:hypothetical protein [Planctomycetaceae bacterium]
MAITRIDFAGGDKKAMTFVTVTRCLGIATITASFLTPESHFDVTTDACDREALVHLASRVQRAIDGCRGTNSMIQDYLRMIELLAN